MLAPALLRTHVSLSTYKMAGVSVLAGDVSRTWLVEDAEGKSHEVQLYHNTVSGARSLLVDGGPWWLRVGGEGGVCWCFCVL